MTYLIALFLLFSTIVDGEIILDEPVRYPVNFYELHELVETRAHGWVFESCDISGSRLYWDSAVNLFEDTEKEFEDRAFVLLTILFFAPEEYALDICGDYRGKPILWGAGVDEFLNWYVAPRGYEKYRLPIIIKASLEKFDKLRWAFGLDQ